MRWAAAVSSGARISSFSSCRPAPLTNNTGMPAGLRPSAAGLPSSVAVRSATPDRSSSTALRASLGAVTTSVPMQPRAVFLDRGHVIGAEHGRRLLDGLGPSGLFGFRRQRFVLLARDKHALHVGRQNHVQIVERNEYLALRRLIVRRNDRVGGQRAGRDQHGDAGSEIGRKQIAAEQSMWRLVLTMDITSRRSSRLLGGWAHAWWTTIRRRSDTFGNRRIRLRSRFGMDGDRRGSRPLASLVQEPSGPHQHRQYDCHQKAAVENLHGKRRQEHAQQQQQYHQ